MSSKKNIRRQIIEFNKKTFLEKAKKRREQAKLPFEEKLKIVEELNALVRDFAEKRSIEKIIKSKR
jgi:hypothetical protein